MLPCTILFFFSEYCRSKRPFDKEIAAQSAQADPNKSTLKCKSTQHFAFLLLCTAHYLLYRNFPGAWQLAWSLLLSAAGRVTAPCSSAWAGGTGWLLAEAGG